MIGKSLQDEKSVSILKKHVATIHCSNTLSLLQRKISNALLYHAYHELLKKDEHIIQVSTLCKIIGYTGNNYNAIKEAIKGIMATILEWNVLSEAVNCEEEWNASTMLASVRIKGAQCTYSYSKALIKLIYSPSVYGRINMVVQSRFKSSYGLALYENCIRYCGLPYTAWFEIRIFKKLMGVPDHQYNLFRDLKRRVLDKAVEEVNDYSNLEVTPEFKKQQRTVEKIRFALQLKNSNNKKNNQAHDIKLGDGNNSAEDQFVKMLIEEWGIPIDQVYRWICDFGISKIQEKINYIKATCSYKGGKIKQLGGYLREALTQDYISKQESLPNKANGKKLIDHLKKYAQEYREFYELELINAFNQMSKQQKAEIIDKFYRKYHSEIGGEIIIKSYEQRGLISIKDVFAIFIDQICPSLSQKVIALEVYVQKYKS